MKKNTVNRQGLTQKICKAIIARLHQNIETNAKYVFMVFMKGVIDIYSIFG